MSDTSLVNVGDALQRAIGKERDRVALVNANFKLHPVKKNIGEQICEKSGTTLSAFLRECVDGLIEGQIGKKAAAKLEASTQG